MRTKDFWSGPDDPKKTIQQQFGKGEKLWQQVQIFCWQHTQIQLCGERLRKASPYVPCRDHHGSRLAEGETSRRAGEDAFEAGRVKFRSPNLKRFHEFLSPWIEFEGFQRVSWILRYGRVQLGDQIPCILIDGLVGGEENFDVGSLTGLGLLGWVVAEKIGLSEHVGENP